MHGGFIFPFEGVKSWYFWIWKAPKGVVMAIYYSFMYTSLLLEVQSATWSHCSNSPENDATNSTSFLASRKAISCFFAAFFWSTLWGFRLRYGFHILCGWLRMLDNQFGLGPRILVLTLRVPFAHTVTRVYLAFFMSLLSISFGLEDTLFTPFLSEHLTRLCYVGCYLLGTYGLRALHWF